VRSRSGIVLLLALLCIVALELAVAGLHFTALQQLRAARANSRGLQLRLSAQSAVAAALASWPHTQALAVRAAGTLSIPGAAGSAPQGIAFGALAERLDSTLFLVRAEARSPLGERARAGYLLVLNDPVLVVRAALETSREVALQSGGSLSVGGPGCDTAGGLPAALRLPAADQVAVSADALLSGPVTAVPELAGASLDAMLPLPVADITAAAREVGGATAHPQPVRNGPICDTGLAWNWGEPAPVDDTDPCAAWFPVLTRAGDLTLDGGRGQGVLYVSGNLVLKGGTVFKGLVLVAGGLLVSGGATIEGAVIAAGPVTIQDASIAGSHCALRAALQAVPALSGPFRPASRSWIPLY